MDIVSRKVLYSTSVFRDLICRIKYFAYWWKLQEMSAPVAEGNEAHALTGHIISTTIGGKNGEPKRVRTF